MDVWSGTNWKSLGRHTKLLDYSIKKRNTKGNFLPEPSFLCILMWRVELFDKGNDLLSRNLKRPHVHT